MKGLDGWMDGWMDGCMDGWREVSRHVGVSVCSCFRFLS